MKNDTRNNGSWGRRPCLPGARGEMADPCRAKKAFALALLLAFLACAPLACCGTEPLRAHAELEWEMRERMPQWGPLEWNAWEAALAAALDLPEPEPPLFPDVGAAANVAGEEQELPESEVGHE